MTKSRQERADTTAEHGRVSGPPRRRYGREALGAVLTMLGTISPDTAGLVAAIVAVRGDRRGPDERTIDRAALAAKLHLGLPADNADKGEVDRCLVERAGPFTAALSVNIFDAQWRRRILAKRPAETSREGRRPSSEWLTEQPEADATTIDESTVLLSTDFVSLLDDPLPPAPQSTLVPRLDARGRQDIAMVEAIAAAGAGAHLAFRRCAGALREAHDLAALLGDDERHVLIFDGPEDGCLAAILRAELHAGSAPPLMLINRDLLTASEQPEGDTWDEPTGSKPADPVSALARTMPAHIAGARGVYLWSVPEHRVPSSAALPWIGACIGPLAFDRRWARSVIASHLGSGIADPQTSTGIMALARRATDPRDAAAMAATARALAATGSETLEAACTRVSGSFANDRPGSAGGDAPFDARLLVCGAESHQLLSHARQAAANGVRVLAHGPPGGGKSAYVRELARRMAGGAPVRTVGPADFLARGWGATERLVRDLWRRACEDNAILVVDEFEIVGGRRTPGDMSNNALLIRSLTDAWLLALDAFPSVPLLVTTNDPAAIDPAILRRFAFVQEFGDRLSPDQERLAWSVILGEVPPSEWHPVGASVADFVLAGLRCRMLGRQDRSSLSKSIEAARLARQPPGARADNRSRSTTRH